MSQSLGIYITEKSGNIVTGHYLSKKGGRSVVHTFTNCTLDWVKAQASEVIHEPVVHILQPVMSDQELEAERLDFAESSDLIDGGPCESCGVIVHIDDFCGHENPDGTSTFFCPDCFSAEHPESNDTFIFLNETQTGPTQ